MPTKRALPAKPASTSHSATNLAQLQQDAERSMAGKHFREAIMHYKALLKAAPGPLWQDGLAGAYRGRALELADKGMLQEALGIWENRSQFCPQAPPDIEEVFLHLRLGRFQNAASIFKKLADSLEPQALAEARDRFATLYLMTGEAMSAFLPAEDPIIAHGRTARSALEAYCRGDDEESLRALAGIPFRSPYRDWVSILKALSKFHSETAEATALLSRIPATSPFAAIARSAELALLAEPDFLECLPRLGQIQRRFVARLRGWSPERLSLWEMMRPLGAQPNPDSLLELMQRYRTRLGADWVRRQGMCLLIDQRKGRPDRPHPALGGALSAFERSLLDAWRAEEKADHWEVYYGWMAVIRQLRTPVAPLPGSDDALRIALIQRRLDQKWRLLDEDKESEEDWYLRDEDRLDSLTLAALEESLSFDPDDKATYVRLIDHYRRLKQLKEARRLLEPALAKWPDDLEVLGEAVETAVSAGAFKKAAGLAARMLQHDPINIRARDSILEAHLAHARKQIKIKRADLAQRELINAAEWARDARARGKIALVQGYLEYDRDPKLGAPLLLAEVEQHGGGLSGRCALVLEAERLGRNPSLVMKSLALAMPSRIEKADLLNALHRLRAHLDATAKALSPNLNYCLNPGLKAGATLDLSLQELELTCETLRRCNLESLRLLYARNGLKRWPEQPSLVLHAFEATHLDSYVPPKPSEIERLEQALERAKEEGDMRTLHRIRIILGAMAPEFPPPVLPPREMLEEIRDTIEGMDKAKLHQLLQDISGGNLDINKLEKQFGPGFIEKLMQDVPEDDDAEPWPPDPPPRRGRRR